VYSRPVILVVDDEPEALTAMVDALARRFGGDYRVCSHLTPDAALADLKRAQEQDEPVALVIADQWLPGCTGLELLERAHALHPAAQRALLVDWGDREATATILQGCAFGLLENYLRKPWVPPEVHLYPKVSAFLAAWTQAHGPRLELVRIIGEEAEPRSHEVREFLDRSGIPHGFYTADSPDGARLLARVGLDGSHLPVVLLLDGSALVQPSLAEVADALGASNLESDRTCDVAIIGAGPAGLAAAVYAASEGLRTIVIEREAIGGQAGASAMIRNYMGFPAGISGGELMTRAYEQSWLFGAKFVFARGVDKIEEVGADKRITLTDGTEITARSIIIATGAAYRRLPSATLKRAEGAGVFFTVPSDTRALAGKDVYVVGGGNSAGQAIVHLAQSAHKVTVFVRGEALDDTMSEYLIQLIEHLPNVDLRLRHEVLDGDFEKGEIVVADRGAGTIETWPAHHLFVMIGAEPHTSWLGHTVQRDSRGYIRTGSDVDVAAAGWSLARPPMVQETSVPGIFAAGDARLGSVKRISAAVGEGASAVQAVHAYLAERRDEPELVSAAD
jgi:thioredoxin reductase (NADPH)